MKKNQKGFTLVELLVVIAILAILATVAVVGYSSFIESANESNDKTLVGQMNTALQGFDALQEKPESISDVIKAFAEMDIDLDDYKTSKDGMYFYWVKGANRVIYVDEKNEVVYPKDGASYEGQWYSLSGEIPMEAYTTTADGSYSVANGGQFVQFVSDFNNGRIEDTEIIINLTGNIDLQGAAFTLVVKNGTAITLDGGNYTISGHRVDKKAFAGEYMGEEKDYGFGLFGKVESGATVTVRNLKISDSIIENVNAEKNYGHSSVLFGSVYGTVKISNVDIDNCVVVGAGKVGSVIGYLNGTATIENVEVTNTHLSGASLIAKAVGFVAGGDITFNGTNKFEITSSINEDAWIRMWGNDHNFKTNQNCKLEDVKVYTEKHTSNTFIPYHGTSGNVVGDYYCGMITDDWYWTGMQEQGFNQSSSANNYSANN